MSRFVLNAVGLLVLELALSACQAPSPPVMSGDTASVHASSTDGVCPDLSGTYFPMAMSSETDSYWRKPRTKELGFGKLETPVPRREWSTLPDGRRYAVPLEFIEIRRVGAGRIEVIEWYAGDREAGRYLANLLADDQVCDKGVLEKHAVFQGGAEGGSKTTLVTIRWWKEADGSIVRHDQESATTVYFGIVQGKQVREVFNYRFKPYVRK